MITAGATTNEIGDSLFESGKFTGKCQTGHLKVQPSGKGSSYFCKEELMRPAADTRKFCVGDLIGSRNNIISMIATSLSESGVSLRTPVDVMEYIPEGKSARQIELWTRHTRLKCIKGRVYGHKITI